MNKENPKPVKAYKNLEFLKSSEARIIRILSEFLEPMARFKKYKIYDTIVFFGSARTINRDAAEKKLAEVQERVAETGDHPDPALQEELDQACNKVFFSRYYEDAVELAGRITEWSKSLYSDHRFVVCSGGGPGIMEAANKGAIEAGGKSIGLNISIPMEQYANPYITPELNFDFHYFFMRKFWFIYLAKALVIFPGGFGTFDELFEVLTLIQTEKVKKRMPIVIYGTEYWKQIIDFKAMVNFGVVSEEDLDLIKFCDTVDDAFNYLKEELTKYYMSDQQDLDQGMYEL
ncbi:MAG: TIGR00730 family Rossman fold protein [Bacillota bacterium]|nr:TIGR00730 family Rossman fold protein [Bacillota bacterium]